MHLELWRFHRRFELGVVVCSRLSYHTEVVSFYFAIILFLVLALRQEAAEARAFFQLLATYIFQESSRIRDRGSFASDGPECGAAQYARVQSGGDSFWSVSSGAPSDSGVCRPGRRTEKSL